MFCFLFFRVLIIVSNHILPDPLIEFFHFGFVLCLSHCFVLTNNQAFKICPAGKRSQEEGWYSWQGTEPLAGVPKAEPEEPQSSWSTLLNE